MLRTCLLTTLAVAFLSLLELRGEEIGRLAPGTSASLKPAPLLSPCRTWVEVDVQLRTGDPNWRIIVSRPLPIKWFSRAVAESAAPFEGPLSKPNGKIVFKNKSGHVKVVPMVCEPMGREVIVSVGEPPRVPSRELSCLLMRAAIGLYGSAQARESEYGPGQASLAEPWSDKEYPWEDEWKGDFFEEQGCVRLMVELLEEFLPDVEANPGKWLAVKEDLAARFLNVERGQAPATARILIFDRFCQLADGLARLGRHDEAMQWLQRATRLFEHDVTPVQGIPCHIEMCVRARNREAEILRIKGDLDGAVDAYQENISILERLVGEEPDLARHLEQTKRSLEDLRASNELKHVEPVISLPECTVTASEGGTSPSPTRKDGCSGE